MCLADVRGGLRDSALGIPTDDASAQSRMFLGSGARHAVAYDLIGPIWSHADAFIIWMGRSS
jgi:hypothetical protein